MGGYLQSGTIRGFAWKNAWKNAIDEDIYCGRYLVEKQTIVNIWYMGRAPFKADEAEKFAENMFYQRDIVDGLARIYDMGIVGYGIVKTVYETGEDYKYDEMLRKYNETYSHEEMVSTVTRLFGGRSKSHQNPIDYGPATMLVRDFYGSVTQYRGTVVELKKMGTKIARDSYYGYDVMIMTSSKNLIEIKGSVKWVKKTTRVSNDTTLVLPLHEYFWFGVCTM